MTFNLAKKVEDRKLDEKKKKLTDIMGKILDIMEEQKVDISEMSDIFTNLQVNYNRMLLDAIAKLKKDAGNI